MIKVIALTTPIVIHQPQEWETGTYLRFTDTTSPTPDNQTNQLTIPTPSEPTLPEFGPELSPGRLRAESYMERVKALPYDTRCITDDFEPNADVVDIIVMKLKDDGSILPFHHIKSTNDLIEFLETTDIHSEYVPAESSADISYVFLVEDLSTSMMKLLGGYLKVPPQVFIKHISGGEFIQTRERPPHDDHRIFPCEPGCPGFQRNTGAIPETTTEDQSLLSFTWWRASAYDKGRHDRLKIALFEGDDCLRQRGFEPVAWERLSLPPLPEVSSFWYGTDWTMEPQTRVFRPYHTITKVEHNAWTCAAEERLTLFECNQRCG